MDDKRVLRKAAPKTSGGTEGAASGIVLDLVPGHLLRRCQQRAVDLFAATMGTDGPTPRQFALLLCLAQNAGISQSALVMRSGIDRSTLAEMLRRMIDRGLVERERAPADARSYRVSLTQAGRAMLERAIPRVADAQARILEPIPPDQRATMISLLRLIADLPEESAS